MPIDPSKIKPGDTVKVRHQTGGMRKAGVPPVEIETTVYPGFASVMVLGCYVDNESITILEHTPARPDWADALVVRDKDGLLHLADADRGGFNCQNGARWPVADMRSLEPITVVIDADGNPPTPEHEWLDADALDKLPPESIVICDDDGSWPLVKDYGGKWQHTGLVATGRLDSSDLARARVLWAPEADR